MCCPMLVLQVLELNADTYKINNNYRWLLLHRSRIGSEKFAEDSLDDKIYARTATQLLTSTTDQPTSRNNTTYTIILSTWLSHS